MDIRGQSHLRRLAVCIAVLTLVVPSVIFPQLADIPIKPGLWETHVIVKMGPGDTQREPLVSQSCFSAGTTLSQYLEASNKAAPGVKCNITNKTHTARHIAYDATCTSSAGITSNSHLDFQVADAEHFNGTSHATMSGSMGGRPLNMQLDKTFNAKFLSTACGNVKPLTDQAPGK